MKTKLNFGCGMDIKKDYVNIDRIKLNGVDVVHDLLKQPYPFKDNTFEEIYCKDVLEHLPNHNAIIKEFHRILKPNGKVIILVPHFTSATSWCNPEHLRTFSKNTYDCYVKGHSYDRCYDFHFSSIKSKIQFGKTYQIWNRIIEPLANKFDTIYENTFCCYLFPAMEVRTELTK
jgi:ubiquinone/menaquinone biosynthesis C-methylase UbiE